MKFTIRDLLLVTVILALAVGWWVDRSQQANEIELLKDRERKLWWIVSHDPFISMPDASAPAPNQPKP